ncbi:biotin--protein ligase [Luteimonas sp. MC1750]|uniref:biotin--protein ligase n=1 Tax=Luteimonas sp. MC1750 TaxID=2799326 RepID=UPI0018F0C3FE|nr:biotin--protein ligase [Luteimonas sp. MC1750]MBJ6984385.1 biotin--protein ligase [Luteimonas sp. MC1750]QQO04995.1 biotin--protein ligase [Luteimonas sp. MC1750]
MHSIDDAGHGEYKVPGGKLVVVDLALAGGRIASVQVSGDFFLEPASALDAINAALVGFPADAGEAELSAAVTAALDADTQLYGLTPEGVAVAVRRALGAGGAMRSGQAGA